MPRLAFYRNRCAPTDPPLFLYRLRPNRNRIGRVDECDVVLPDGSVSRTHAIIECRDNTWEITDRSSNGTLLNEQRIEAGGRRRLAHGDQIRLGAFVALVDLDTPDVHVSTEEMQAETRHEEILEVSDGLTVSQAWLVIRSGPGEGERLKLRGGRLTVGGHGSRVVLPDPEAVRGHVVVRLYEGRAMIEPGEGAARVGAARVRDILPILPGDEVRIGRTEFSVVWDRNRDKPVADHFGDMVGTSLEMQHIFGTLRRMAPHSAPVLLLGESGTGKELAARGLHDAGPRAAGPFVAVNCGAIPETLFESEMFGHEKGAFTGATDRRDGAFLRAEGGTLFLDEIGELREEAQTRLLRALESGEIRRVGGQQPLWPDVRVVAATNRDLKQAVADRTFRADLFFRLNVLSVTLPPLRERPGDLPLIAATVARRIHPDLRLSPETLGSLQTHTWPGNVRELRNVLTRAYILSGSHLLTPDTLDFQADDRAPLQPMLQSPTAAYTLQSLEEAERALLTDALRRHKGNRSKIARDLGIARTSLLYRLQKLGLDSQA